VGVEPTGDRIICRPPVLKTGTITGPHALPQDNKNNATEGRRRVTTLGPQGLSPRYFLEMGGTAEAVPIQFPLSRPDVSPTYFG
jgi:hypothetical protein